MKITRKYENKNNGGQEFVARDGNYYYVNSLIPKVGWIGERAVTRAEIEKCLSYTNAPADVIAAILG